MIRVIGVNMNFLKTTWNALMGGGSLLACCKLRRCETGNLANEGSGRYLRILDWHLNTLVAKHFKQYKT